MRELVESVALPQLEGLLTSLEQRADDVNRPSEKARIFNLAGDMCFDAAQPERGLSYYDKAITTYTECEQYVAASRICEKILALSPDSVRPYATLCWLAIMRGLNSEACGRIRNYVAAATAHGLSRTAREYLLKLADDARDRSVLETIADALTELQDRKASQAVQARIRSLG